MAGRLDDQHRRGHQGGAGQQDPPRPAQRGAGGGRLLTENHRRVQCGWAHAKEEETQLASTGPPATQPTVSRQAVNGVSDQQDHQA